MKICLIVYKIDPVEGSENASGYHLAREIVQSYPQATLISRQNNIDKLKNDPAFKHIELIGLDVPRWLSFYKRGSRGIILYYYLWQCLAGRLVRRLDRYKQFNVIHQINFHADWAPHFLSSAQAKIIWGPIAHHPPTPLSWLRVSSIQKPLIELANRWAKACLWLNPWLKRAMRQSDVILFAHDDIPKAYQGFQDKIHTRPYGGSHWPVVKAQIPTTFQLLFVGRLIPLKGPHIAIDAFEHFLQQTTLHPGCMPHLTLIGQGELNDMIAQKAQRLNQHYGSVVTLHPWLERDRLQHYYRQSDYLVYPSLEAQGLVVSEALSQNCLPITLVNTGPATISSLRELTLAPASRAYDDCVDIYAHKLQELYHDQLTNSGHDALLAEKAYQRAIELQWPVIAQKMTMFYDHADA